MFRKLVITNTLVSFLCHSTTEGNMSLSHVHIKCRGTFYPRTNSKVRRLQLEDEDVQWETDLPSYNPPVYTAPYILATPPYADPCIENTSFNPKWNSIDGNINRLSYIGPYGICSGIPRNPQGRTGLSGRGCLGRWGPNHAADPVVTRWKLSPENKKVLSDKSGLPILEFVSIERRDCGQWAIPGGMVDPGEKVTSTLKREFLEEALCALEMTEDQRKHAEDELNSFFASGVEIYAGYVDDPRNTDNAWMETVAYNFHEDDPRGIAYRLKLEAGDDAKHVCWMEISSDLELYASHKHIIEKVALTRGASW